MINHEMTTHRARQASVLTSWQMPQRFQSLLFILAAVLGTLAPSSHATAAELKAGAAKVDITNKDAGPVSGIPYVKALVITDGKTTAVIATVDAVAIGQIGSIRNDYLGKVRASLKDLGIAPENFLVNASHCHAIICEDIAERTVQAVKAAMEKLEPVTVGVGRGSENRVSENRRILLKNGREADVRHAYSMPADEDVADVGPIDPEIGILRLDRKDGTPLAIVYNFACHPIMGVPSKVNTGDITSFSNQAIEDCFGEGTTAIFLQGCGGDINPIQYKAVNYPRDAEPLGNLLALSTIRAAKKIQTGGKSDLRIINEPLELPRADLAERIAIQETQILDLVRKLTGTTLNLKTFIPLVANGHLSESFPSYYSHQYLHERKLGRADWDRLDKDNRAAAQAYLKNVMVMKELTRMQTNLKLLQLHQAQNVAAGKRTVDVELVGFRLGDFVLVTSPGELTVRIGLGIKKASPHPFTFVAGYTNGYIYYAPTKEQLLNLGGAQEDSDCILAPEWQEIFEAKVASVLKKL